MNEPTVFIIDDDEPVRDSLRLLMKSVGHPARTFASADEFLESWNDGMIGCLLLDIRMPGMSGLDLQKELNRRGNDIPIIFVTGHGDVPMAVEAMKRGAMEFIQKPFREQELIDRVNLALERAVAHHAQTLEDAKIKQCYARLTPREKEILELIVAGKANKVIAAELGTSQRTVETQRAGLMLKLEVKSIAELVSAAHRLKG